jgi:hypothetical protein
VPWPEASALLVNLRVCRASRWAICDASRFANASARTSASKVPLSRASSSADRCAAMTSSRWRFVLLALSGPAREDGEQRGDVRRTHQDRQDERPGRDEHGRADPGVVLLDVHHDQLDLHAHRQEHGALEDEFDRSPVLRVGEAVLQ